MPNLKKVISLHQASQISGYHQDYLSALIRKNEMKGQKIGGSWFTTEDEIKNYIFKQKIRNKNWLTRNLLSFVRMHSSFIYATILLLIFSTGIYFYNQTNESTKLETTNTEISDAKNLAELGEKQELKF